MHYRLYSKSRRTYNNVTKIEKKTDEKIKSAKVSELPKSKSKIKLKSNLVLFPPPSQIEIPYRTNDPYGQEKDSVRDSVGDSGRNSGRDVNTTHTGHFRDILGPSKSEHASHCRSLPYYEVSEKLNFI